MQKTMILSTGAAKPGLGDWDREGGGVAKKLGYKQMENLIFIILPIYTLKSLRFY